MFQLMCEGGCGSEPTEWIKLLKNLGFIFQTIVPLILIIIGIIVIVLAYKKNNEKKKSSIRLGIALIAIGLIVFLSMLLLQLFILSNYQYDDGLRCWCK